MDKALDFVRLFGCLDEIDEQMAREGAAIKKSFHSIVAKRGTPRRKARVAGGPKNRANRKGLVRVW